ncbi:unnamed protein product [Camellia sinensis]
MININRLHLPIGGDGISTRFFIFCLGTCEMGLIIDLMWSSLIGLWYASARGSLFVGVSLRVSRDLVRWPIFVFGLNAFAIRPRLVALK